MAFKLIVTDDYVDDFNRVADHISDVLFNPIASQNLAVKARKTMLLIKDNPFIFPIYHDERLAELGYRFAAVANYLLLYKVDENEKIIYISHFIYGRQNIQRLIK